jgi:hypothetical protein
MARIWTDEYEETKTNSPIVGQAPYVDNGIARPTEQPVKLEVFKSLWQKLLSLRGALCRFR